jgi:hypothetical protein
MKWANHVWQILQEEFNLMTLSQVQRLWYVEHDYNDDLEEMWKEAAVVRPKYFLFMHLLTYC